MDLYTLTPGFLSRDPIDEYISAIWTERFTELGDLQLSVPLTETNLTRLAEGTRVALIGTEEVMEIHTLDIQNNIIKASGSSLLSILSGKNVWNHNPDEETGPERVIEYSNATFTPGEFMSHLVETWAIAPSAFPSSWSTANLDWEKEAIPFLTLGPIDSSGTDQLLKASLGPIIDALLPIAREHSVGLSLYLDSAEPGEGYSLKFKTYKGEDRTSDQEENDLVRLVPELDGISNIKEIRSNSLYKNVAYVFHSGIITEHLAEPELPEPEGLERKSVIVDISELPTGDTATRNLAAANTFANANYVHAIDGQTSPIVSEYKYGIDYGLGDIIELEGLTGAVSKARITEFIRSDDATGERGYPTISVI